MNQVALADPKHWQKLNESMAEESAQKKAQEVGWPYWPLSQQEILPDTLALMPKSSAEKLHCIPVQKLGNKILVATYHPEQAEAIKEFFAPATVALGLCSEPAWNKALEKYDEAISQRKKIDHEQSVEEDLPWAHFQAEWQKLSEDLINLATEVILEQVNHLSLQAGASDVHYQPQLDGSYVLRLRIDGLLHEVLKISAEISERLRRYIKYQSGMKANVDGVSQEGRLSFSVNDRTVDVRVSILPTEGSESIVMRILDSHKNLKSFEELGFSPEEIERIQGVMQHPNGIILMTGPTGSGKTTTLYSMLQYLNAPEKKIITLEDPIEYHLENIIQSPVDEEHGYDYETGFKSLMRHDPDIAMIGEIRSPTTAHLAIEAALTGHLVLSSLHTNSAIESILRLRNFHLENYNLASALRAIIAQRLVRRVCEHCVEKKEFSAENSPKVQSAIVSLQKHHNIEIPSHTLEGRGCEHCSGTGYRGRVAILELLEVTPEVATMIRDGATPQAIYESVSAKGFRTLWEDGVCKMLQQKTTLSEIFRVIG